MGLHSIIKLFNQGNVCVTGLRGTGKDMLFANVIARSRKPYISNMDYKVKSKFIPLDFTCLNTNNSFNNFISGKLRYYNYPYPEKADIFVSDCGVYFPSQYTSQLDKYYPSFPVFQALSRHLGDCNFHINSQNLNRVWNKIREQSDIYINCNGCIVLGKLVLQSVTIYDKYQSCIDRVQPYKHIKPPLFASADVKAQYSARDEVLARTFANSFGKIKRKFLVYFNRSNYDTRLFKSLLLGGSYE